jgi:ankyrin repeat protein
MTSGSAVCWSAVALSLVLLAPGCKRCGSGDESASGRERVVPTFDPLSGEITSALHYAVINNEPKRVKALVAAGADLNQPDPSLGTPLMLAAELGRLEVVKALKKAGADMSRTEPAALAAKAGHEQVVTYLTRGEAHTVASNDGRLMRAVNTLDHAKLTTFARSASSERRDEALKALANKGDTRGVEILLKAKANPNQRSGPETLLHHVMSQTLARMSALGELGPGTDYDKRRAYVEIASLMIKHGADATGRGCVASCWKPLEYAGYMGLSELIGPLVRAGAKLEGTTLTPAMVAAAEGDLKRLRGLIQRPQTLEAGTRGGFTALALAAQAGHGQVIRELVKAGAKVDGSPHPLWIAVRRNKPSAVKALLEAKVDTEVGSRGAGFCHPILHVAVKRASPEIVAALLKAGAKPESCASRVESLMQLARRLKRPKIIKLLKKHKIR